MSLAAPFTPPSRATSSTPPTRKLRIAIVQGAFLPVPALRGGAVEKIWFALGKAFAARGHEVTHLSRLCDGLPETEVIDHVRHLRVPGFDVPASLVKLKLLDLIFSLRIRRILPASDVVVTNTFFTPCVLSPRRHGALWVHVQRYPKGQMRLYTRAARLQTVSSVIAHAMIEQAPAMREKVCIIPNPVSPVQPLQPVRRDDNLVLFVGRLHPEKGVTLLLEAFAHLKARRPEARLRIVGPWQTRYGGAGDAFHADLLGRAAPFGSSIEFTGPVFDERALAGHYAEAGTFAYPTLAAKGEASPVAPVEALSHGLPVVVSDLECFNDYLQDDPFALRFNCTAPDAADQLARALDQGLIAGKDPGVRAAAISRAASLSIDAIADRYLEGFMGVVQPNRT
ncbi:MAG: glycosyltransferase family 4 protein [Verrucomicrobiota bacterium]